MYDRIRLLQKEITAYFEFMFTLHTRDIKKKSLKAKVPVDELFIM